MHDTPKDFFGEYLKAANTVLNRYADKDPYFKQVLTSQRDSPPPSFPIGPRYSCSIQSSAPPRCKNPESPSPRFVIALFGFIEAISIAKAIAAKTRERIDPNQDLIGQGLANIAASLTHSFPVSGSFSRSALNLNAGAVTGMSSVFSGLVMLLTLLL